MPPVDGDVGSEAMRSHDLAGDSRRLVGSIARARVQEDGVVTLPDCNPRAETRADVFLDVALVQCPAESAHLGRVAQSYRYPPVVLRHGANATTRDRQEPELPWL